MTGVSVVLVENSLRRALALWQNESAMVIGVKHRSTPYWRTRCRNSSLWNRNAFVIVVFCNDFRVFATHLLYRTIGAHIFRYVPAAFALLNNSATLVFGLMNVSWCEKGKTGLYLENSTMNWCDYCLIV